MIKDNASETVGDAVCLKKPGIVSEAGRNAFQACAHQAEPLAYGIVESCRRDGTGRSTKYKAINPDPCKRDGLPFLPSFNVGRRRLILAADHQEWLEKLREASLSADPPKPRCER